MRRLPVRQLAFAVALFVVSPAFGQSPAPSPAASPAPLTTKDLHAMVVGIGPVSAVGTGGDVFLTGFPISTGAWGTDYLTSSHALRTGMRYGVTDDGKTFARLEPVAACSAAFHRIDVMIFRAATLPNRRPLPLASAFDLKANDDVEILPRKEFNPSGEPSKGRMLATRYLDWIQRQPGVRPRDVEQIEPRWHDTMVSTAFSQGGFSGSPWARNGFVVGIHKGTGRLPDGTRYALGETLERLKSCLEIVRYQESIPGN